jgi:hypothetical protein
MRGTVVIGEGEKDEAPMLYKGEHVTRSPAPPTWPPGSHRPDRNHTRGHPPGRAA